MTTQDFIIELFCRVDDAMKDVSKHPQAKLHPSELATIGLLYALKGVGQRAFYRWLLRDYKPLFPCFPVSLFACFPVSLFPCLPVSLFACFPVSLFPCLPERTRLFRALAIHQDWTRRFLAEPTMLGICDSYAVELLHPRREGRSDKQIGKKGKSNHRWIIAGSSLDHRWIIAGSSAPRSFLKIVPEDRS